MPTSSNSSGVDDENLFVYGTLRQGCENEVATLVRGSGRLLGGGRVAGRLYWVAHYPGLVLSDSNEDWARGDVYRLEGAERLLRELDKYEGCGPGDPQPHEYERAVIPVLLDSGEWIAAAAYVYALDVSGKRRIESGDFLASVDRNKQAK